MGLSRDSSHPQQAEFLVTSSLESCRLHCSRRSPAFGQVYFVLKFSRLNSPPPQPPYPAHEEQSK